MKPAFLRILACLSVFTIIVSGCANRQNDPDLQPAVPESKELLADVTGSEANAAWRVQVKTASESIIFTLNDSPAAKSLYHQLPLTLPVEDYGVNEKIFYLPQELDVRATPSAKGPAGTLAYFEPWGNVAIFYGECSGASGLYALGEAISGIEQIKNLSGEIRIEKLEDPTAEPTQGTEHTPAASPSSAANSLASVRPDSSAAASSDQTNISNSPAVSAASDAETFYNPAVSEETESNMRNIEIAVGGEIFTATLYDNSTAAAFAEKLPLTLEMREMNGNEKYYYLDSSLPANSKKPDSINSGDLMLYGNSCIVLFYKSFSAAYSYTALGRLDNPAGLAEALGSGNVTVSFQIK